MGMCSLADTFQLSLLKLLSLCDSSKKTQRLTFKLEGEGLVKGLEKGFGMYRKERKLSMQAAKTSIDKLVEF